MCFLVCITSLQCWISGGRFSLKHPMVVSVLKVRPFSDWLLEVALCGRGCTAYRCILSWMILGHHQRGPWSSAVCSSLRRVLQINECVALWCCFPVNFRKGEVLLMNSSSVFSCCPLNELVQPASSVTVASFAPPVFSFLYLLLPYCNCILWISAVEFEQGLKFSAWTELVKLG